MPPLGTCASARKIKGIGCEGGAHHSEAGFIREEGLNLGYPKARGFHLATLRKGKSKSRLGKPPMDKTGKEGGGST